MVTKRDIEILRAVAIYYVLSRVDIQRLCFPKDKTGRATRRRLQALVSAGLLNRTPTPVFNPQGGSAWPAYFPSRRGLELLAQELDDQRFLGVPSRRPEPYHLLHWLAVTQTHIAFDHAIARQDTVHCDGWLNEWDTVNPQESQGERRYRLYTLLRDHPRLVCVPDAAFLLAVGPHSKVFYLEQDRATIGIRQFVARKTPGYAALSKRNGHRRHFPQATVDSFSVLAITPTARRRDALRKALRGKAGADLWKFASQTDLTPETFLHNPVFFPCEGDPVPLVKKSN
jgi:hypothetical protein